MPGGGPRPGHAPTHGLAKEIWNMSDEEVAERFGEIGDDERRVVGE